MALSWDIDAVADISGSIHLKADILLGTLATRPGPLKIIFNSVFSE